MAVGTTPTARPLPAPVVLALAALTLAPASALTAEATHGHSHDDHAHSAPTGGARLSLGEAAAALRRARAALPPPPQGVTELDLGEIFDPIGDRGPSYSEKVRALEGRPVRILGYMVGQDRPVPGTILLAPFPFRLHESEYGLAEDLPPALVHVLVPDRKDEVVPFTPGLLLLTGDLALGPREEPDGRISTVRLRLHPPPGSASIAAVKHHPVPSKENDE